MLVKEKPKTRKQTPLYKSTVTHAVKRGESLLLLESVVYAGFTFVQITQRYANLFQKCILTKKSAGQFKPANIRSGGTRTP